ncbi:hypothetical protein DFH11DRAFT_1541124 [Phellopilus nigrolimitatus]|nr:hypothetical protein DFH11DRAFT_1541124 [Phellopilus nigrolimitatus]
MNQFAPILPTQAGFTFGISLYGQSANGRVAVECRARIKSQQSDNTISGYPLNVDWPHGDRRSFYDIPANQANNALFSDSKDGLLARLNLIDSVLLPSRDTLLETNQLDLRKSPDDLSATTYDNGALFTREVVGLCGRIESLILNVQDKWDKVQDEARGRDAHSITVGVSPSVASGSDVLLGKTTVTKLLRTQKDVKEAICEMENHEPEIAKVWNKLREENTPATRSVFSRIRDFVGYFSNTTPADSDSYRLLEETYHQMLFDKRSPAIALHWRALLHTYDRTLDFFNEAFEQTQEILCRGLFEVFVLARGNPSQLFLDSTRTLTAKNRIIEEASQVAESVVTGCFGANLEVFVVDPGRLYDSESMVLDGQDHTAEAVAIKCTVDLGLHEVVPRACGL